MKMRSTTLFMLSAAILLCIGLVILARPMLNRIEYAAQAEKAVDTFFQENHYEKVSENSEAIPVIKRAKEYVQESPYPELLAAMQEYNEQIYSAKQSGLSDPWCYTAPVLDLSAYGLSEDMVGVLTIPTMDYEEPVYLGATADHLSSGAAQLSIGSMPIGGINTNCVLAGHRGWNGALHLQHIELLQVGDPVTLTNLWDVLEYRVAGIKIIKPWQPEELLIQEGRDLLTLITCHPYGSGGNKDRYVVFCERIVGDKTTPYLKRGVNQCKKK